MTGLIVSACLLFGGIAALYALIGLLSPTALRKRPNMKHDRYILGGVFNYGRGGHSTVWSVPRDDEDYAKIWSNDR